MRLQRDFHGDMPRLILLTSYVEVDGMRQETFAGNTSKERSDGNEAKVNCVWV